MSDKLIIKNGTVSGIFSDELGEVLMNTLEGKAKIERASYVEPISNENGTIEFEVDLSLSNGPKMRGFKTHKEAIDAEIEWLNTHHFILPPCQTTS